MFSSSLKKGFFALLILLPIFSQAETRIIKDVLGREAKVKYPAKRIAISFYYTDFLAVGGPKAFDHVVGFSKSVWKDWSPPSWQAYIKEIPRLDEIADFGEIQVGSFSIEKILSLKPDVLILADWQYQVLEADLEPITKSGIPIVVIDYNSETLERHITSTLALGQITGQEKRAEQIVSFHKKIIEGVQKKIADAKRPRPKIYIEYGAKGPNEVGLTYGKDMWGVLMELAGGENIAAPFVEKWSPINPEQVMVSRPEVIMITGREAELNKSKEAMVMGVGIQAQEVQRRLGAYKKRAGWDKLPAIKNGRLYGLYNGASRTIADGAMVQYIAKALYPDLFEDIDPIETYLEFHRLYLPIVPEGTFGIQAQ